MSSSSKKQTTMAKMARERLVKERRARKQEKRDERKQAAAESGADAEQAPEHGVDETRGDLP